jgi:hypothetical protein
MENLKKQSNLHALNESYKSPYRIEFPFFSDDIMKMKGPVEGVRLYLSLVDI